MLIEDAAESLGATYKKTMTGGFGEYGIVSYNGNKLITDSSGGALLTHSQEDADKVRKWSTQAREAAPWYQHEELGYNYRMGKYIEGFNCTIYALGENEIDFLNDRIYLGG